MECVQVKLLESLILLLVFAPLTCISLLLIVKLLGGAVFLGHLIDSSDILLELLLERRSLRVVNHVSVYFVLNYDQAEQVVVDYRCLHLVQLFRVLADTIFDDLGVEEEVPGHQESKYGIAKEFKSFVVVEVTVLLLMLP